MSSLKKWCVDIELVKMMRRGQFSSGALLYPEYAKAVTNNDSGSPNAPLARMTAVLRAYHLALQALQKEKTERKNLLLLVTHLFAHLPLDDVIQTAYPKKYKSFATRKRAFRLLR